MCELFAANAKHPLRLNDELAAFFGDSPMHPHGWGIAVRNAQGAVDLKKAPERAVDSTACKLALASDVRAAHLLAHIRYATKGGLSYDNTHPFIGQDATGREWSFVHNGSIFHSQAIDRFQAQAKGESDSEQVLLYLMDALGTAARNGQTGFQGRFSALSEALVALAPGNKLNVVLDDGDCTYVFTNTEEDTLFVKRGAGSALFCTRPLGASGWQPLAKCRLLAFRDGALVAASDAKSALYHFDKDQLDAFLLANAA